MQPAYRYLLSALTLGACNPRPAVTAPAVIAPAVTAPAVAPESPVTAPPVAPESPVNDQRAAAQGLNRLGVDLFAQVRTQPGNLALAPGSIALALGMTEAGARGETLTEMRRVLHSELPVERQAAALGALSARWNGPLGAGVTARTANRLFGHERYTFEAPYLALTASHFSAPLERLDFSQSEVARVRINGWVAEQTMDKIRDLLPPASLSADTRLVLANAMYLRAPWATPFPASSTHDAPFYVDGSTAATVPTMTRSGAAPYAHVQGVSVVELPYAGGELAMTLFVPDARDGLAALEATLTSERLAGALAALAPSQVALHLPRFRVATETLSLRAALVALGMNQAFRPASADFAGIANPPSRADRLYISDVFHKVFVDVSESGTEASAATAVAMGRRGALAQRLPETELMVDRPFVFAIRDTRTGAVLFLGRVLDPRAAPGS